MFEKTKLGVEINSILRSCDMHAGLKHSEIEKDISKFYPMFAKKIKAEGLSVRQATVALISYYVSLSDARTLIAMQEHVPLKFFGVCCLWRGAKALNNADPATYSNHIYVEEPAIDTILTAGFEALVEMTDSSRAGV